MNDNDKWLNEYNNFCKNIEAGSILYNIDSTNQWGEYLLVINVASFTVGDINTYTVVLMGLKKQKGHYISNNNWISFTPDYAERVPFLKQIGYCKFFLVPTLDEVSVNVGLAAVYSSTDLHKFATNLSIRKPRNKKYDRDGKPVIKKPRN